MKQKGIILIFFCFLSCHPSRNTNNPNAVSNQKIDPGIPYYSLNGEQDLDPLIKAIGNAEVVLLGESTHGTHEFYKWRTAITKRLISEKGFDLIAVEGDWTDAYKINQFIK